MPADHAHFNGSVNLADTESVMRAITERVPAGVRRIPDGETGDRENWIFFQLQRFLALPWLVPDTMNGEHGDYEAMAKLRLADGANPAAADWGDLGYAAVYQDSYRTFTALRDEGVIPAGARFQVQYPTPLASIGGYIVAEDQHKLLPSYEQAMFADLDRTLKAIPHDDVAVQWDVAVEFGLLEGAFGPVDDAVFGVVAGALARCIDQVPADVPAGLHLCYGDYGHQHFTQPTSLALQVRVLNAVAEAASRPVSFVSFTVPQNQAGEAYFAPLAELRTGPETELNFALVPYHADQQPGGTTKTQASLIDAALANSPAGGRDWGICTECGMGRAERGEIGGLLDLYRQILS